MAYSSSKKKASLPVRGKLTGLKLDVKRESSSGKAYKVHLLKVEDEDGNEHKFSVGTKSKPAEYVSKLKEGMSVAVQQAETEYGKQVVAVYINKPKGSSSASGGNSSYNPLGVIQGMVLKAAIDLSIARDVKGITDEAIVELIVDNAKVVLSAREKVDSLVKKALAEHDDAEDTSDEQDDDSDNDDESDSTDDVF